MQEEIQQKDEKQEYQYFDLNAIKEKLEFSKENWQSSLRFTIRCNRKFFYWIL